MLLYVFAQRGKLIHAVFLVIGEQAVIGASCIGGHGNALVLVEMIFCEAGINKIEFHQGGVGQIELEKLRLWIVDHVLVQQSGKELGVQICHNAAVTKRTVLGALEHGLRVCIENFEVAVFTDLYSAADGVNVAARILNKVESAVIGTPFDHFVAE